MYTYRSFSSSDSDAVRDLIGIAFSNFLDGNYWDWKHLENPKFDPSLVAIAEKDGEIVGCSHWLQTRFKIAPNIVLNSLLTCDMAVKPEHRGHGIAKNLVFQRRNRETFKNRGIIINYDFANPTLARKLYTPLLGYTPLNLSTKKYYKLLNWRKLIQFANEKRLEDTLQKRFPKICDLNISVCFKIKSTPQLTINLSKGKIKATEEIQANPDIVVEGNPDFFISLMDDKNAKRKIVKGILGRKIKIKGRISKLLQAYRNIDLLEFLLRVIFTRDTSLIVPYAADRYKIRSFEEGDEIKIIQLFNKAYMNYSGYVPKTPEYWRWCCLERPDVEHESIFVAVDPNNGDVVGHIVAGKSGNIWEFCYDPDRNGKEIASLLLDRALEYLEKAGAISANFTAPKQDEVMKTLCAERGFTAGPPQKMFLSVLNLQKLISLVTIDRERTLTKNFDEKVLIKLKETPFWVHDTVFIQIDHNGVKVEGESGPATIQLQTDFITLSSIIFGNLSPFDAFITSRLRITPPRKISTSLRLLSSLQIKAQWSYQLSEFG